MKKESDDGLNYYFNEREQQAVIDYNNSDSAEEKNRIYNEILKEPFRIMTESILRRYPIHIGNYNMNEIESNALAHLIEKMASFNPERVGKNGNKTKAYSYCQAIIRYYYIDHGKRSDIEKKVNLPYETFAEENSDNLDYSCDHDYDEQDTLDNLINLIISKIQEKIDTDITIKDNEIIVGEAIINILSNWHLLFQEDTPNGVYKKRITNKFAKNKILFFLKEQTGLSTKEIRIAIKPFKDVYYLEKSNFLNDI